MPEPLRTELHPEAARAFERERRDGRPRIHQLSVAGSRRLKTDAVDGSADSETVSPAPVERRYEIPGPSDGIEIKVYAPDTRGPHPAFVWFHGGGWVRGGIETAEPTCRYLAERLGWSVVAVDYRRAPENPFPAGVEDCHAAAAWVASNPEVVFADPDRVAVGGASAGGNLAAATALLARDRGEVDLSCQVLGVPITDRDFTTDSYRENAEGYGLTRADMEFYWARYLARDVDAKNPYVAPLRERDLSGLPPALVLTGGFDPLRDEGVAYAERLGAAGVDVEHAHYPDMPHQLLDYRFLLDGVEPTVAAHDDVVDRLRETMGE
jgi:acetyl esterase